MNEYEFISAINDINKIKDYDQKIKTCREFLLNNCNEKICSKKYLNGRNILEEIEAFYSVKIQKTEDVFVNKIYGTKHPNYVNMSPYDLIKGYGNKISDNLNSLCFSPENYFLGEFKDIYTFSYNDSTAKRKHIISLEGNHRFSISKVINSFVENDLFIKDVKVQHFELDWELKDLIIYARELLNTYGFELELLQYYNKTVDNETYNIFTWIKIKKKNKHDYIVNETFIVDKNNLKESEELNRLKVKEICKNIEFYIKKYNSFFLRIKRIFYNIFK